MQNQKVMKGLLTSYHPAENWTGNYTVCRSRKEQFQQMQARTQQSRINSR